MPPKNTINSTHKNEKTWASTPQLTSIASNGIGVGQNSLTEAKIRHFDSRWFAQKSTITDSELCLIMF